MRPVRVSSIRVPAPASAIAIRVAAASSALAYGLLADHVGLGWTFGAMAALTFAVIPLAVPIRRQLAVT